MEQREQAVSGGINWRKERRRHGWNGMGRANRARRGVSRRSSAEIPMDRQDEFLEWPSIIGPMWIFPDSGNRIDTGVHYFRGLATVSGR